MDTEEVYDNHMDVHIQYRFVPNVIFWKWNASFSSLHITDWNVYISLWSVQIKDLYILGDISYVLDFNISLMIYRTYTPLKIFMLIMTNCRLKCHHLNVGEQYHYVCTIEYTYVDFNQLWRLSSPLDAYIRKISPERFLFRFKWMHLLSIVFYAFP